jgi:hypothetical protein
MIAELRWQYAYLRVRRARMIERFWFWLAWAIPKKLVYFSGIRLWAHATQGEYSHVEAPAVTMDESIKRWET